MPYSTCPNPESLKNLICQASLWSKELLKLSGLIEKEELQ